MKVRKDLRDSLGEEDFQMLERLVKKGVRQNVSEEQFEESFGSYVNYLVNMGHDREIIDNVIYIHDLVINHYD